MARSQYQPKCAPRPGGGPASASASELARTSFANGEGFLPSPALAESWDPRDTCYKIAIAAELGLKAFLASQGWSDDRCRRDIRHDFEKGLASTREAGLVGKRDELAEVLAVLNAYYPHHAFDRFDGGAAFASKARAAIAGLLDAVRPYVEASGGR